MSNIELLKEKINDSGMTVVSIAKKSGILRETLYNRLNGEGEWKVSEVRGLTATLRLNKRDREEIFLK
jgi:predicted transcriptional regulator